LRLRRGTRRRRQGLRLAARIGNGHGVRHIANDDRVVDVAVDHVVRRGRRHISRRTDPYRHWPVYRHRQQEESDGRRRRREQQEFRRRRRQENDGRRRRRCEREVRIVEHEDRSLDKDNLLRRRRRQIVGEGCE